MKKNILTIVLCCFVSMFMFAQEETTAKLKAENPKEQATSIENQNNTDKKAVGTVNSNLNSLESIKKILLEKHEENNKQPRPNIVVQNKNKRAVVLNLNSTATTKEDKE